MERLTPGQLVKYLTGGATALLLLWLGAIVLSELLFAIIPLLGLILGIGAWWNLMTGGRRR